MRGRLTGGASCMRGAVTSRRPARPACRVGEVGASRPAAAPALWRTCHPNQRRAHWTHGVSVRLRDANLWKLDLTRPDAVPVEAGFSSTLDEATPSYSPDGQQVVFASNRSGSQELWISGADGASPRKMTSMDGPLCAGPLWAREGNQSCSTPRATARPTSTFCSPSTARSVV